MAEKTVRIGSRQFGIEAADPIPQASVNAETVLVGSELDARMSNSVAYSYSVITNTVTVNVYGALAADFSDERQLQTQDVAGAGINFYTSAPALYSHYRVKILSTVGGAHGTVMLHGVAK